MRDLGERLLHAGDFSYEDITGQDEPPVDSPTAPEENTATRHQKTRWRRTNGCGPRISKTDARENQTDRFRTINRQLQLQTQVLTLPNKRQKKIMMTRGDELTNPLQQFPQQLKMKFWYRVLRHLIWLPEMMRSLSMLHCLRRQ